MKNGAGNNKSTISKRKYLFVMRRRDEFIEGGGKKRKNCQESVRSILSTQIYGLFIWSG